MDSKALIDEILADIGTGNRNTPAAAKILGVSPRAMEDWRPRGVGPRFIRISGRAVRYRARELARFMAEREVSSTSDPGPVDHQETKGTYRRPR